MARGLFCDQWLESFYFFRSKHLEWFTGAQKVFVPFGLIHNFTYKPSIDTFTTHVCSDRNNLFIYFRFIHA